MLSTLLTATLALLTSVSAGPIVTRDDHSPYIPVSSVLSEIESHTHQPITWSGNCAVFNTSDWEAAESTLRNSDHTYQKRSAVGPRQLHAGVSISTSCYNSGQWSTQRTLERYIDTVCDIFSVSEAGPGSTMVYDAHDFDGRKDEIVLHYVQHIRHYSQRAKDNCKDAMRRQVYEPQCQGESQDTQGGRVSVSEIEGIEYSVFQVDPNAK